MSTLVTRVAWIRLLLGAALTLAAGGCTVVRTPADPDARVLPAVPLGDSDWPLRGKDTQPFVLVDGGESTQFVDHGPVGQGRLTETTPTSPGRTTLTLKPASGSGRVRITVEKLAQSPGHRTLQGNWLVFSSQSKRTVEMTMPNGRTATATTLAQNPNLTFAGIIALDAVTLRGTVVFLSSIESASAGEEALQWALVEQGWAIVVIGLDYDTLVNRTYLTHDDDVEPSAPAAKRDERVAHFASDTEGVQTAAAIAHDINDTLAERAYAAEATIAWLREHRPDWLAGPLVVLGASAGAINVPTVAARLQPDVDAAVIIAGGADLFGIAIDSTLMRKLFKVRWNDRPPTPEQIRKLHEQVLAQATMDPYHTATHLAGVPTLMLHARDDRIVPAKYGDVLWERLGRPERWTYSTGHIGLFLWLPSQADEIADWIDQAVGTFD